MYFLYNAPTGSVGIYIVDSLDQAETLATRLSVAAGDYAVFDNLDDLPADWQTFPQGVTLTLGPTPSYGYSLTGAKVEASTAVKIQNAEQVGLAANNLSSQLLTAQVALPEGDRIPEAQAAIEDINVLAAELQTQLDAIATSTSISDLNAVVNPPALSGEILIDRDSLTLDTSTFVSLVGATAPQMTLYFPATDTTLSYDALIDGYSSGGADVFAVGNYGCILKYLGNAVAAFDVNTTVPTVFPFSTPSA